MCIQFVFLRSLNHVQSFNYWKKQSKEIIKSPKFLWHLSMMSVCNLLTTAVFICLLCLPVLFMCLPQGSILKKKRASGSSGIFLVNLGRAVFFYTQPQLYIYSIDHHSCSTVEICNKQPPVTITAGTM